MFLWRNILLVACCLLLNCTLLNAQDIDYSKCSCDSLFKYVIKDNYLKSYSDNYQGKRRYIDGNKCITVTDFDSTIVRYETETLLSKVNDSNYNRNLITIKTDSTVFHKNNNTLFSEVELYERKVSDIDIEYKFFKKDFGLELRLKVLKSIIGKDSVFYYYSEKYLSPVYESDSISFVYALNVPINYTLTIDTNGYLHGRYISYCPNGKKMTVQTYLHGVRNGYFYFTEACKLDEDLYGDKLKKGKYFNKYHSNESDDFEYGKGYYKNGERTGRWILKLQPTIGIFIITGVRYKRYVLKYSKDNKVALRRFLFFYKKLPDDYSFNLCCPGYDLSDVIQNVNLYYRIANSGNYQGGLKQTYDSNYDVIKIKGR